MSCRAHSYLRCAMVHRSCKHIMSASHLGASAKCHGLQLRVIPTVGGSSLPGLSYLGALRMLGDCRDILEEGYRKVRLTPSPSLRPPAFELTRYPLCSTRDQRSRSLPLTNGWLLFRGGTWLRSSGNAGTTICLARVRSKRCVPVLVSSALWQPGSA